MNEKAATFLKHLDGIYNHGTELQHKGSYCLGCGPEPWGILPNQNGIMPWWDGNNRSPRRRNLGYLLLCVLVHHKIEPKDFAVALAKVVPETEDGFELGSTAWLVWVGNGCCVQRQHIVETLKLLSSDENVSDRSA